MTESMLIAIIGVIGTIAGAILGGLIQRGTGPLDSKWAIGLGALFGLLVGILVGAQVYTSEPSIESDGSAIRVSNDPTITPTIYIRIEEDPAEIEAQTLLGPFSGRIKHEDNDYIDVHCLHDEVLDSNIELENFNAEVVFHNPYDKNIKPWSYGIIFRSTGGNYSYRLSISSKARVGFGLTEGQPTGRILWEAEGVNYIDTSKDGQNVVRLEVAGPSAELYINDHFVTTLDVSEKQVAGRLCVGTGILKNDKIPGETTDYTDYYVEVR
jgi:hypothetical protein